MTRRLATQARRLRVYASRPRGGALLSALVILAILLPIWWWACRWYQAQLLAEQQAQAATEASVRANALSLAINRRLALLQGLYAFVQVEPSDDELADHFGTIAAELYANTHGVRNIIILPGGVARYIYPLDDNAAIVSHDFINDLRPGVYADMQRAIYQHSVTLSGPLELPQGGTGLAAWLPVYQGDTFWGLVAVVLDVPTLLQEAELNVQSGKMTLALRDSDGQVFYGPSNIFARNPVVHPVDLPEGSWELAVVPTEGWQAVTQQHLVVFQVGGLIIVGLLTGLAYLSVNRQARLALAVRQRTQEITRVNEQLERDIAERLRAEEALRESEERYRSAVTALDEGIVLQDAGGIIRTFNAGAERILGLSADQMTGKAFEPQWRAVYPDGLPIPPDMRPAMVTLRTGQALSNVVVGIHKPDGTLTWISVNSQPLFRAGETVPYAVVASFADITERLQAYQLLERRVEERTRELTTLLEVTRNVTSTLDLKPLLELILDQLKAVVDYDSAAIFTLQGERLERVGYQGHVDVEQWGQLPVPLEHPDVKQVVLQRIEPTIIADVCADTPDARVFREMLGEHLETTLGCLRSWMWVPLTSRERIVGGLSVDHHQPDYYTPQQARLAMAFAQQASMAIENAKLYQQAQQLAAIQERQRLARELHDSVSQALYGIGLGARTARTLLDRDPAQAAEPLDYIRSLAEAGLAEMRALIFELRPESLQTEGLVAGLAKHAAALRARYGLEVHLTLCDEPSAPLETKEALYRIAQEALHNTVRHARASQVAVRLECNAGTLILEARDDGVGFDPGRSFPGHLGLRSMSERAERLGGTFEVNSALGSGTRIRVRIPTPPPALPS